MRPWNDAPDDPQSRSGCIIVAAAGITGKAAGLTAAHEVLARALAQGREIIFSDVKALYDLRSNLVHGAIITQKELEKWLVAVSTVSTPDDRSPRMRIEQLVDAHAGSRPPLDPHAAPAQQRRPVAATR